MSDEDGDRHGMVGKLYLYKRICQIGFLSVTTGEAAKTYALHSGTINEDHLLSKSPGTRMRTFNTPEGQAEFKGSDDESCSGKRARTRPLTYQRPSTHTVDTSQNMKKWVRAQTHKYSNVPIVMKMSWEISVQIQTFEIQFRISKIRMLTCTLITWSYIWS